jgi:hypothetical protein
MKTKQWQTCYNYFLVVLEAKYKNRRSLVGLEKGMLILHKIKRSLRIIILYEQTSPTALL